MLYATTAPYTMVYEIFLRLYLNSHNLVSADEKLVVFSARKIEL